MPRRPRAQVRPLRKRTAPAAGIARRRVAEAPEPPEGLQESPENEELAEVVATAAPAPYIRRREVTEYPARSIAVGPAIAPRPNRGLVTDYGYIVSELQRTGLTFGGLIVLLVIVARLLH